MLDRLKDNRLKITSGLCVLGDALMGLAGASGLYHAGQNPADLFLFAAGVLGLMGHSFNIIWGKGGQRGGKASRPPARMTVWLRPFFMWRYPMDAAFALFVVGGLLFVVSGALSGNPGLVLFGVTAGAGALLGWLWPEEKTLCGLRSVQITALLYVGSAFATLFSGVWAKDAFILAAGCCYMVASIIFYTVRKENQSRHTIGP